MPVLGICRGMQLMQFRSRLDGVQGHVHAHLSQV